MTLRPSVTQASTAGPAPVDEVRQSPSLRFPRAEIYNRRLQATWRSMRDNGPGGNAMVRPVEAGPSIP
jgi:hypothetical protein